MSLKLLKDGRAPELGGSSVELNEFVPGKAPLGLDFNGGLSCLLPKGISWDLGAADYSFSNQNEDQFADYNFGEVHGKLGYTFSDLILSPRLRTSLNYRPDYFGEDGDGIYTPSGLGLPLPHRLGLNFAVGYQDVEGAKSSGPSGFDYTHWQIGLSKKVFGLVLDPSYADAHNQRDCGGSLCDGRVIFSISASGSPL